MGSLRVFVAVAHHLNFTRAAEALGVSASAASLQIRALEEYLGRALLRRDGRHVSLTDEGASLLPRVRRALEDLEGALDDVRADRGAGILRVSMLASFVQQWLLPRLPRFQTSHPAVSLYVNTSHELVDFARSEHQVAIRFGSGPRWPGVEAEKLLDEWLVPVCVPSLLRDHGLVDDPQRLHRYPLLHGETEPWSLWRDRAQIPAGAAGSPSSQLDDSSVIVRAAARGQGLALARWSLVADEVADGSLVVACSKPLAYHRIYWFVYPRRVRTLATVEAFRAWIFGEAAQFPSPKAVDAEKSGARPVN
ncbi:MAG TPA: LysR substrate-binding domain-containing protein [Steroidobacteraceae bacterium]|jgi:LysR family glycine cleavage system transcriptional activator|nr:LysR substrate-binding domain-containing protein [Steroidobacteraceae bacterium]